MEMEAFHWKGGLTDGRTDAWMDGCMDGRADGLTYEAGHGGEGAAGDVAPHDGSVPPGDHLAKAGCPPDN